MTEKSAWQKYKETLGETRPWDLIDPSKYLNDMSIADSRYAVCQSCPFFINLTKQCSKCGCVMTLKTKLELAECPEGKW